MSTDGVYGTLFQFNDEVLKYTSAQTDTYEERRIGLVRTIKMGLMKYLANTPLAKNISIKYTRKVDPVAMKDKWNNWVFFISGSADLEFEQSDKTTELDGSFSAERVTPDW